MFFNYLKLAVRKLFSSGKDRSSIYSWINLGGLAIGLTAFLLIGHFVHYELGYDRFYPHHKNIYRLAVERFERGELTMHSAKTYAGIRDILIDEIHDVSASVRVLYEECMFLYEPENLRINRQPTFWADGNFHEFFGLEMLVKGQLELLHKPNHALISRAAAERLFGAGWKEKKPLGKIIILNEGIPFMIQGIFEDIPENTHFNVDFVVSYATLSAVLGDHMNTIMPPQRNFVYNYITIRDASNTDQLEPLINQIIADHTGNLDDQVSYSFSMQPLASIHLDSHLSDELNPNGNRLFIQALSIAAVLIVLVAWINFINLTIARAMNRSKEVGVRKAIGARKRQIAMQFAQETLFSGTIAALLTVVIAFFTSNYFNSITGITVALFSIQSGHLWMAFLGIFLIGAILASVYPALVLSSFNPTKALKGKNVLSMKNGYFRQGLIAFQFGVAMLLIACTGAVYYQVNSMRKQSLGVELNQVLVIHSPRSMIGNTERALVFKRFRDKLEQNGSIVSVASGACLPGEKFLSHTENVQAEGNEVDVNWSFDLAFVDERYLSTLGMKLVNGRNFKDIPDEENKVILNETAIGMLGFKNAAEALGQYIRVNQGDPQQIIGVVEDAHFEGLQTTIKPLLLRYGHGYEFGFFPIKIKTQNLSEVISTIEQQWKTIYPKDPFDYFFLDKFFDQQYANDQAFGNLFGTFAILTICIAGLGLFGLISLTTYQKSKEIGIRKVFGANVFSIVKLLTLGFLKLVLLSSLIAIPLAYWIIDRWLNTFAYRFEPSIWMYGIPVMLLLITSLISVGGQTLKSALKNPVDAIADE